MARNAAVGMALAEVQLDLNLDLVPAAPSRAEAPSEEFRTLRTRLEQLRAKRAIQAVLVASASTGDGKSFTAANLALAQAQLPDNFTLLCDFDLRNPTLHSFLQIDRSPGIGDYLLGKAELHEIMRRIGTSNLFVMPAGQAAINPLELLHLRGVRQMMDLLRSAFRSILLDSPPLLVASDANVLAGLADGTLLIGSTTPHSMTRAIESLSPDSILGIVANGI
jgi:protein-tyrosine kinase